MIQSKVKSQKSSLEIHIYLYESVYRQYKMTKDMVYLKRIEIYVYNP